MQTEHNFVKIISHERNKSRSFKLSSMSSVESGDLPIAEQRFFDPYVAYTGKASKNRSPRSLNVFDKTARSNKNASFLVGSR